MITERTLKKWRAEALSESDLTSNREPNMSDPYHHQLMRREQLSERILKLTQELLDAHLLRMAPAVPVSKQRGLQDNRGKALEKPRDES